MGQNEISRYLTYSFLVHLMFLGGLLFVNLSKKAAKTYYAVDFVAGMPAGGRQSAPAPKEEPIKTQTVNPEEDLLLKSKKKIRT